MAIESLSLEDVAHRRFTGGGYVLFHIPDATHYVFVAQRDVPPRLTALKAIDHVSGVVIVPFRPSARDGIFLIRPDVYVERPIEAVEEAEGDTAPAAFVETEENRRDYERGFEVCKRRLSAGRELRKVVYARRLTVSLPPRDGGLDVVALFEKACRSYPHSYVTLWWTQATGCWIVATPEQLIVRDAADEATYRTMALAGTMPWQGRLVPPNEWSDKNRTEHAYVVRYIEKHLSGIVRDVHVADCCTVRAADVIHLRTDFSFRLRDGVTLGATVGRLHPTPAVCGDPPIAARSAIREAETFSRHYYAGFSGPVNLNGLTGLYVSLRCMQLQPDCATLYAGGGLLAVSQLEDEWNETCRKFQTMLKLLEPSSMPSR